MVRSRAFALVVLLLAAWVGHAGSAAGAAARPDPARRPGRPLALRTSAGGDPLADLGPPPQRCPANTSSCLGGLALNTGYLTESWLGGLSLSPHVVAPGQTITGVIADPAPFLTPCYSAPHCLDSVGWNVSPGEVVSGCRSDDFTCTWRVGQGAGGTRWMVWQVGVGSIEGGATDQDYYYVTSRHIITGTVTDVDGHGLAGVRIQITGPAGETVATDSSGFYSSDVLPAGDYAVTAGGPSAQGAATFVPDSARVRLVTTASADFRLNLAPATFTAHMKPRFSLLNRDADGVVHEYTDDPPDAVSPSTWTVQARVDRADGGDCQDGVGYSFTATSGPDVGGAGQSLAATRTEPCWYDIQFPSQGTYQVEVVASLDGDSLTSAPQAVDVRDFLIVGLGDSVASGEGVPDDPAGAGSGPVWENAQCDRSAYSFEDGAALALVKYSDEASVTFVHLACSGANVLRGLLGPYTGEKPYASGTGLPAQVNAALRLANGRPIDAVIVSVGANDIGFGSIVSFCLTHTNCENLHDDSADFTAVLESELGMTRQQADALTLGQAVEDLVNNLPNDYAMLNNALQNELHVQPSHVFITQYCDPTHGADGDADSFCSYVGADVHLPGAPAGHNLLGVDEPDVEWAFNNVVVPMNNAVQAAAGQYGWTFVNGVADAFAGHGYCSPDSWITFLSASLASEFAPDGDMHPTREGQQAIADLLTPELEQALYPSGPDGAPAPQGSPPASAP